MMNIVHTQIVKIGNSRGVRLPKLLIEQMGFGNEVEIVVQRGQLVIRSAVLSRHGWADQFRAMADHGDDKMLDKPVSTQWDRSEWKW
ncbi:MAG: AbrB/MazE/SpoVT family DNA-binding domain-containing protein [Anaerolineales bacterium]|nr:AbrB/MazE/SpoVT family DNA-binding domain-containing protein [Anaerolineales bacterium]